MYPPTNRSGKHVQTGEQWPPSFTKISLKLQKYSFMFTLILGHDKYFISATVIDKDDLIFPLCKGIFNTFMFRVLVSLKKPLFGCLIFTLYTWACKTFMLILLVSLKLFLSVDWNSHWLHAYFFCSWVLRLLYNVAPYSHWLIEYFKPSCLDRWCFSICYYHVSIWSQHWSAY